MPTVQPPMAGLVVNPMVTAVLERSLQQSEILENRRGACRGLGARKCFFTPSFIVIQILLSPIGARKSGT